MKLEVGRQIISYDFPHVTDCFMIGVVTSIKDGVIECETVSQVLCGKSQEITEFNKVFRTVVPGAHWMDKAFVVPRIQVVG